MNAHPRVAIFLCFIQAFFVVAGSLVTRVCLKLYDQIPPNLPYVVYPRTLQVLEIIRWYGLWFLLIPLLWSLLTILRTEVSGRATSLSLRQFAIGILLTFVVALIFSITALRALNLTFGFH